VHLLPCKSVSYVYINSIHHERESARVLVGSPGAWWARQGSLKPLTAHEIIATKRSSPPGSNTRNSIPVVSGVGSLFFSDTLFSFCDY